MTINEEVVNTANNADDPIATCPGNPQDAWWRYRLKGSSILAHDVNTDRILTPPAKVKLT
ncbi:putative zinc protease pqqL domain protein, partial [Candidatus Erwinia dacicola]